MKTVILFLASFCAMFFQHALSDAAIPPADLKGAWRTDALNHQSTMICSEKYFAVAIYDLADKKFIGTHGGSYRLADGEWIAVIEFHSMNPERVGTEVRKPAEVRHGTLTFHDKSGDITWRRVDDATPGKLAGAWLITGRVRNGQMSEMTPGARRTMKILSGTRFQWIAYNAETKAFSGTGGGTYTTAGGKYTENIEFFSRDDSRVGASLIFDFAIEDGHWRHTGFSSKGDPIDEVWTRREKIGL